MIYITGDIHGEIERFRSKECKKLKKGDTLIVLGDFGFLWDGSKRERRLLKWIGKRPYQVLFLEGSHDNLELISKYPKEPWNGGMTRIVSGKLRHLCRGYIFYIEEKRIFAFGGGVSSDEDVRLSEGKWWAETLPNDDEIKSAWDKLSRENSRVDYIVTHQSSLRIKQFLSINIKETSSLDVFLDEVRTKVAHKRWFFGEIHKNKRVTPTEIAVFDAVMQVEG